EEPDGGLVGRKRGLPVGLLSQEADLDAAFMAAPDVRTAIRAGAVELERLERELSALEAAGAAAVGSARSPHPRHPLGGADAGGAGAPRRRGPGAAAPRRADQPPRPGRAGVAGAGAGAARPVTSRGLARTGLPRSRGGARLC